VYVASTSSLRSFEIAKGHSPPFNKKVFATLVPGVIPGQAKTFANNLNREV
jgi:hypothetical protein